MKNISLLFLTYSNPIHKTELKEFFENCNIYIHSKYPEKMDNDLKKFIIPNLIETKWGDKSIINATLELLKVSYKNTDNKWFILCSEDIYPLVSYDNLNSYLDSQTSSVFDVLDKRTNKTSQFWALKREDVKLILSNQYKYETIFRNIPRKTAYDELFFLPLLKLINPDYNYTETKFCYVKWFDGFIAKHPTVFNCLLQQDIDTIESNHSCFIRKTYPTFKNTLCPKKPLTILITFGTESIKNYEKFITDFKDIANIFILSLLDSVDNKILTENCSQSYFVVWNDVKNAIDVIKRQFTGDLIITSEQFDINNLKNLLKLGKTTDENNNSYDINFKINELKFFYDNIKMLQEEKENSENMDVIDDIKDSDEIKDIKDIKPEEVFLKLGDIILISDPTNEILNDNIFLIEYIDRKKIKLINSDNFEKTLLQISSGGVIGDGHIKSIKVISSNPESGYARQNDLLPGTWVNIYFGGEIPTVITGEITNLEEDMIEIRTTDGDTLYINFNYQGIPEDLPIETFEIRPAIKRPEEDKRELSPDELVELGEQEEIQEGLEEVVPKKVIKDNIQRILFDMDDIEFGDVVNVEEFITIDKDKYRYNIETQTNDMLEELISGIPNTKRTNNVLNSIHMMITRFIQLRKLSSTFDLNNNITGIIKITSDDRPLAEYLSEFKNTLYWILMVAKNVKKIYPDPYTMPKYRRYDDYETINIDEDIVSMSTLFKNYKSNNGIEGQNKYTNLYYSLDPYLTPFYSVNPGSVEDVFAKSNGIIIEGNVETNINAIVDNLGELYSTVVERDKVTNRKFVIQRYNLGEDKLHGTNFKGQKMIAHRVKLTENDQISINSIITLPEPTVRFSQVNLPGTNLLVKANLNLHFLNYWELLKQKTSLTPIIIDGLDNELEYDDTNFVDNIKQYLLDLSEYEKPEELTNLDIYKIFLRTIIPKIRVLFSLVKKYIKGRLSLVDVVNYLEPFLIYPIDLTYMQYNEINKFIYDKIKNYNTIFKEYAIAFSSIKYLKTLTISKRDDKSEYVYSNELFYLLDASNEFIKLKEDIFRDYELPISKQMTISPSEFIKRITLADFGNLFNTAVALTNIKLMYPSGLSEVFNTDKDKMKEIMEKDKANDKCSSYIIAKKYYSIESLMEDNDKQVYFDKEFDTTNYDIVNEKYKKQRDELTSEEFILYLSDELKKNLKMDEASSEYMATTLANQAKKVREGDYALLTMFSEGTQEADKLEYYVRNNNIWVQEKDIDPNAFIKEDDMLCNMEYSCIYNPSEKEENKCESTEVSKDSIVNNALKQVLDQFDKKYDISKDELNSRITTQVDYFKKSFDRLQKLKRTQFVKYNKQKYELGLKVSEEIKDRVVSPYKKLKDLIMGQNDFVKKQTDIISFVSLYCREGDPSIPNTNDGEMENEWWLYCVKTNTKLLPKFVFILADTFITKNSQYINVLDELKRKIGKRSDDGDSWVDENSGEVICYIDLDVTEGYREGFVDSSRDILEKDSGEIMLEKQKDKKDKRLSPEGELVSNVVSVLSTNMGLNIEQFRDYIVKIVTELMNDVRVIEKEPAYRKREEEAAKKGKKIPSYAVVFSSTLIYLTLGTYLIAIQTSIPSLKTRKTAPGCVRSFSGFPFEGEGDDSGLNYVACVAMKSRDPSTVPWNALPKSDEKIATILKSFMVRYLLPYAEIEQKIKEKTEYLLSNPESEIPDEYNLNKWTNFLPPLSRFHVKNLQNVSDGFTDELQNEIYTGNYRQLEKLLVIDAKIISFSLAIQEAIQKLVEKKNLLLKSAGQIFMDNACCNEEGNKTITTLQYFINEDKNIEYYNTIVAKLSSFVRDIKILTDSAVMLSEVNTKRIYPEVSNDFSEETIYIAFISLCKFQSSIPLSEELVSVCIDKPDYLNKMESIQEKISKLKRDGRNYTHQQFLRLFQIVSRNNIIKMSLGTKDISCVTELQKILLMLEDENNEDVPKALTQKLDGLVQNYDLTINEDTREMRVLKDYLQITIGVMRKEILDFIKTKSRVNGVELKNITTFLTDLTKWKFDETIRNENTKISDDALYNYVTFLKNFIELFAVVFPTMIINEKIQSFEVPTYLKISRVHENDITNMLSNFYGPIEKFYGSSTINNILYEIKKKCRGIYLLSKTTPILTNIKMGEKDMYYVFDKRTVTLLYEYYFLSIFSDYINLTKDPSMVTRMLVTPEKDESDLYSADFLIEQQLRFTETEQEFIEGDVMKLKQDVAKLLVSYLSIMMRSKKTLNVSYDDVSDTIFKLKEAEKYDFTDRLKDLSDEGREIDTILKHYKLGAVYSIGVSKGIKEYDPENFDHDKEVAERVTAIQNKLKRNGQTDVDQIDMDDEIDEMNVEREIEMDNAMDMNPTDDYDDGDPWGDEVDNRDEYD